jgi:hypothetical protein
MEQIHLTDTDRILHQEAAEYTFFSAAQGIFSKIDNNLGHKTSIKKY